MDTEKPLPVATQINVDNLSSKLNDGVSSLSSGLSDGYKQASTSLNDTLSDFSSGEASPGAPEDFLQSNSIIAKFVFLIFVLIVFMILLSLGIILMGNFLSPSGSPYLVKGTRSGTDNLTVSTDPSKSGSIPISRSNNQSTGMEFTWSIWLYITDLSGGDQSQPTYQHIFNKGDNTYNSTGVASINNAPGLYLLNSNVPTLHVVMNSVSSDKTIESMDIDNLPLKKWFHVAIRMQNKNMDAYINGIITGRVTFTNVPKQNYQDVFICQNGGFSGSLSNLRYYDYALNIFDINTIVLTGPNTTPSTVSTEFDSSSTSGYTYLSSSWYANKM
jgi:hypothetical protein